MKEGPGIAVLRPIQGPGVCGADYPLKVAALGESTLLGFAEALRPPGLVPQSPPYPPGWAPAARPAPVLVAPLPRAPTLPPAPRDGRPQLPAEPWSARGTPEAPISLTPDLARPGDRATARAVPLGRARAPALVATASVTPPATLACPIVSALERWITDSVQPAAQRWFASPVADIQQISAYSCRGMNGQPGARISEHAFGNALDIAAFTLADGRTITVRDGWRGAPEEQGFLRDIHAAACEQFTTVLAPGSNAFHYDHIHLDLMRRASGRRICEPGAVSGEEIARAQGRFDRHAGDRTGAIGARRGLARRAGPLDDEWLDER